ncbi:MAG: LacI family DNA-binding transcriptional regulator [Aeromonas sp.]
MVVRRKNTELKKATLHEVAKQAGVSIATVSRAINNKAGISEENRKHVLAACAELDYPLPTDGRDSRPTVIALSLGPHDNYSSRYLGMLWPALSQAIGQQQHQLLPLDFAAIHPRVVDAVILVGMSPDDPRIAACQAFNLPYVCIGMVQGSFWVAPDDFNGGRLACEHLIEQGLKNIAFVTPTVHGDGYQFRFQGYMSVMGNHALPVHELRTGSQPVAELAAYRYFFALDAKELENYQGFVCECDETAIGVITALRDRGYTVPEQFSVVGYDGLPSVADELTTIEQDVPKIVERIALQIELAIAGDPPAGAMVPIRLRKGATS